MDVLGRVVYNFLTDLPEDRLEELPADIPTFANREKSELSYELDPEEASAAMETLADWAGWLVEEFESHPDYTELESFGHLQRALNEQCHQLAELEEDDEDTDDADPDDADEDSAGWEPQRTLSSVTEDDTHEDEAKPTESEGQEQDQDSPIELRNPSGIPSDSLHSTHDNEATYRRKRGEEHFGYVTNLAETVNPDEETENRSGSSPLSGRILTTPMTESCWTKMLKISGTELG